MMFDRADEGRWWDFGWQLIEGCTRIADGCKNCWSLAKEKRFRREMGVVCHPGRLDRPLKRRKPASYAVWNDLFHEKVPEEFIHKVLMVMANCNWHTFQILTKRPQRAFDLLSHFYGTSDGVKWPFDNVWLGVSCSTQAYADKKIPILLQIPAAVHFVSLEPLLGPVDLSPWIGDMDCLHCKRRWINSQSPYCCPNCANEDSHAMVSCAPPYSDYDRFPPIDQVIVGGESGPGARPMHPQWVRDIRVQCVAVGVPFFFKQWGKHIPWSGASRIVRLGGSYTTSTADVIMSIDGQILEIPNGPCDPANSIELNDMIHGRRKVECFDRVGKKKAGRILDGRTWDELPKASTTIVDSQS